MPAARKFLAVRTDPYDLGLDASRVMRVVQRADWHGHDPPDLELVLYGVATENPWRRVLVIDTPRGLFPVGTGRELVLRECRDEDICGLPHFLWDGGTRPLLWGISMPEEGRPLLLLDRDALAACGAPEPREGEFQ